MGSALGPILVDIFVAKFKKVVQLNSLFQSSHPTVDIWMARSSSANTVHYN